MSEFIRYAVFYVPPRGDLARFGAEWLGWDLAQGASVAQPQVEGIETFTATPRKYGFHATLKPPFRLHPDQGRADLEAAIAELAASRPVVMVDRLVLSRIGRFLALVPQGDVAALNALAAACVSGLDRFRAAAAQSEIDRRRAAGLSDRQDSHLIRWGYPYVMDEFRFHMTLSGAMDPDQLDRVQPLLAAALPRLPSPFVLDRIALAGQREDGMFHLIHRYALTG